MNAGHGLGAPARIAYIDCVGGVAGDMLLAALLDAGASEQGLLEIPERLGLVGVEVRIRRVERHGISALHVTTEDGGEASHHQHVGGRTSWRSIRHQIEVARLDEAVRATALRVLDRLARAEARVHGAAADDVHFHEIGAVDTLVDVVGVAALLDDLGAHRMVCSPLPIGRGAVTAAHGFLPLPAPATAALLVGAPVYGIELEAETVTPTGAALVASLADSWGPLPRMTVDRIGYGAGTADFATRANLVRVMLGEDTDSVLVAPEAAAILLETNLDDLNPELVPDAVEECFAAGALDVWSTPALMKKGRPAIVLSALARADKQAAVAAAMLTHTSALGVRATRLHRYELERERQNVIVNGHEVGVKVGRLDGKVVNVAPEHDDCAELARTIGTSVKAVWTAALAAASDLT